MRRPGLSIAAFGCWLVANASVCALIVMIGG